MAIGSRPWRIVSPRSVKITLISPPEEFFTAFRGVLSFPSGLPVKFFSGSWRSVHVQVEAATTSCTTHAADATRLFSASALHCTDILKQLGHLKVDIVVTDIPYGSSSSWQFSCASLVSFSNPAWHLLQSLLPVLSPCSIVAIAAQKQQKIAHEEYKRVEYLQVGKRKVVFLVPTRMSQG